jgi:hypothetical protein
MQDNKKYSARFLGGAVHNQLNDADKIILEKIYNQELLLEINWSFLHPMKIFSQRTIFCEIKSHCTG